MLEKSQTFNEKITYSRNSSSCVGGGSGGRAKKDGEIVFGLEQHHLSSAFDKELFPLIPCLLLLSVIH